MSKMKIFVLVLAIGILAAGSLVYATGEKALRETSPAADVSPERGDLRAMPPVEPSQILAFGDELAWFPVQAQVLDNQILGIGFDGTYMWATGGGTGGTNMLYQFDAAGSFMLSYIQASPAGWGWRDLCYEATTHKLWGSASTIIQEIDPNTGLATGNSIPSPVNPARAEAWQPPGTQPGPESGQTGARGYIWTGSFYSTLYRVCVATGVSDGPYSNPGYAVYGAAWNDCDDCPPDEKLWWTDQNTWFYYNMDPITRTWNATPIIQHTSFLNGASPPTHNGMPGGLSFAAGVGGVPEWSSGALTPDLGVLLGMCQCPTLPGIGDAVWAYELCLMVVKDNDMMVASIDEPGARITGTVTPKVTVKNAGLNTQNNVPVNLTIVNDRSGLTVYDNTVNTGTLNQGETEQLTFPDFTTEPAGIYTLTACTQLSGDENTGNDCKSSASMVSDYFNDFEVAGCFTADPDNGWEWGEPTWRDGPPSARSGTKVWGTKLAGDYTANACYKLDASFIALVDDPYMEYYDWYEIYSSGYDGYNLKMSVNGGSFAVVPLSYNYTAMRYSCIVGEPAFVAYQRNWELVAFTLAGVQAGDRVDLRWTFGDNGSTFRAGAYIDDLWANGVELAPPNVDLDVDDDYANLVANTMTLVGVASKKNVLSYTFGDFVVVNPKDGFTNVDYWDGPSTVKIDDISYEAEDLYTYHHPDKDPIPAGNIAFSAPQPDLGLGEAMVVLLAVEIPGKKVHKVKHSEEKHVYRGTITVTGDATGECGSASSVDEFTLNVKVTDGKAGTVLPNSFVGDWDEKGVTLSWGSFSFGQSYNLYREDESGEFVKLNSAPMNGNSNYIDENVVEGGTYLYKFGIILNNGEEVVFGPMTAVLTRRPAHANLMPSVPNPMNTETVIRYSLANDADVSLKIYDVSGSLVKTLVNEPTMAGYHSVVWDGTGEANEKVANGVYFYRLNAGDFTKSHKLVVLK